MLSIDYKRTSNVFVDVNVAAKKNHNCSSPLILEKYNIILVIQILKVLLEFTFAISVECLHSILQAKLVMHNCARAKQAKTYFCSI